MPTAPLPDDPSELLGWFRHFLFTELGVRKELVTLEAKLHEDLGADSMDQLGFILELEEQFDITIPDAAAAQITTVGDAIAVIQRELSKRT